MMQAASDIYLGWTKGVQDGRYLYWRQLRDMKGSVEVESMIAARARVLRRPVRLDAGSGARALRRPDRDRRLPGQERSVRRGDRPTSPSVTPTRTSGTTRPSRKAIKSGRLDGSSKASDTSERPLTRPLPHGYIPWLQGEPAQARAKTLRWT